VGVGKERGGVLAVGAREGEQGVRARVPAAGKVLEGDDQRTLSPLYYDFLFFLIFLFHADWSILVFKAVVTEISVCV